MSKYDLPLEEISENITDTILKEKYLERGDLIKKITTLLKVHLRIKNKPRRTPNKSASVHKLQWTIAKEKCQSRYWLEVVRKLQSKEEMTKHYLEQQKHIEREGFKEYVEQ